MTQVYAVSFPGTAVVCNGVDQRLDFLPPRTGFTDALAASIITTTGGGSWPVDGTGHPIDFTIIGAEISCMTDSDYTQTVIGLSGACGDTLTPLLMGQGTEQRILPAGYGQSFSIAAGDVIHFHCKSSGSYAIINGAIIFTVP